MTALEEKCKAAHQVDIARIALHTRKIRMYTDIEGAARANRDVERRIAAGEVDWKPFKATMD